MKLVLLPGLDGTGVLFRPLLAALPASLDPIVIAYPSRQPLSYDELVSTVRDRLPSEPFTLLGESFGGPLALRLAAESPSNLRALILAGSFISCPYPVPRWTARLIGPLPFRTFPFFAKLNARLGLYGQEPRDLSAEALSMVAAEVFAHRVREIVRVDVRNELLACSAPILYLQGTRDRVVWEENLRRIHAVRSDVHCVRIDSGHMILKSQPHAAARAIAEFVQKNSTDQL